MEMLLIHLYVDGRFWVNATLSYCTVNDCEVAIYGYVYALLTRRLESRAYPCEKYDDLIFCNINKKYLFWNISKYILKKQVKWCPCEPLIFSAAAKTGWIWFCLPMGIQFCHDSYSNKGSFLCIVHVSVWL